MALRLLLINFEMDPGSQVLSWQYRIACGLAAKCEKVVVLTERSAPSPLPPNVEVHTVPLTFIKAPLRLLGAKWLMNVPALAWCARERFDACFIHMNMEWGYRLALCFRMFHIPVVLWYAHGTVTRRLRLAHRFCDRVLTSTPEGFRIPSDKVRVIGQGIDTGLFKPIELKGALHDILSVGRIARRKRTDLLIEVMACLRSNHPDVPFRLVIIGAPLTRDDRDFSRELEWIVRDKGLGHFVHFEGHVPQEKIPDFYRTAFLHLNVSKTGSMDKTVMESLACGCPVLTSNEAFRGLLSDHPECLLDDDRPDTIARRVINFHDRLRELPLYDLRSLVVGKHDIESYINQIIEHIHELSETGSHRNIN